MKLYFRTARNVNGNCKFIGIDTELKQYATQPNGWISKEYPELKAAGYKHLLLMLERENFKRVENM